MVTGPSGAVALGTSIILRMVDKSPRLNHETKYESIKFWILVLKNSKRNVILMLLDSVNSSYIGSA